MQYISSENILTKAKLIHKLTFNHRLMLIMLNYNLRSSSQLLLQPYNVTKTKKTLGDRAFQVASPGLWNGLPYDIRNAKTMDVFKSLVKTHLFRKAYACYF